VFGGPAGGGEYTVGEAVDAYKRACALHGWAVPKEFDDFLKG
jgi:ubiquitin-conjugating enzyme E2 Q